MRAPTLIVPLLLALLGGCPSANDDDSPVANDDDLANDDDSADDDDSAAGPTLDPCAYALVDACADLVMDAPGAVPEAPFRDPARAVNGVHGAGATAGGTDVFSLDWQDGASLTVSWSGRRVLNGPGPDFAVFENGFENPDATSLFMDLMLVELSIDGIAWVTFPHDYVAPDETVYSTDPAHWPGFAGRAPVLLHDIDNPVSPLNPELAGGDAFDLDDLGEGPLADTIREDGFLLLRLVAAPSRTNPDTGAPYVADAIADGGDIDGIYAATLADVSAP